MNVHGLTGKGLSVILIIMTTLISGCGPEKIDEILATGTIEMTEITLSGKTGGRIKQMFFEEGQMVKKGELMVELDHDQLDARIWSARSGLQGAQANLNAAQRELDRLSKLWQSELISQAEYDRVVTSKEVYEAQVNQAEANLNLLQVELVDTRLYAPISGVVSAKLFEPGEVAPAGSSIYTILNQNKPWIKIYLPLKEVEQININQPAIINLDAFPELNFKGRISHIAQEAEFTPKDYLSQEERVKQVYEVRIELEDSSGKLKAGVPAEVRIKLP
jgi:HlyD family secretion protein